MFQIRCFICISTKNVAPLQYFLFWIIYMVRVNELVHNTLLQLFLLQSQFDNFLVRTILYFHLYCFDNTNNILVPVFKKFTNLIISACSFICPSVRLSKITKTQIRNEISSLIYVRCSVRWIHIVN